MGEPPCVTAHTPTVCDAWCQSAPGGALWCEGLQPVAVGAQPCALECGIGGGILGVAGGKRFARARRVRGWTGKRTRKSSWRQAKTLGPLLRARQTASGFPAHRWRRGHPHASRASGVCSRMTCARVAEPAACQPTSGVASAQSRPPQAAHTSGVSGCMSALPRCGTVGARDRRAGVLRRHEREPRERQPLRMR